jgi:dihydrolipoamide dehydrogenase
VRCLFHGDVMQSRQVDVAVIGAGSAGLAAFHAARAAGKRVLLIESGEFGTLCARSGCMPSKLLIAAANGLHDATSLGPRGINGLEHAKPDGRAVLAYVRAERDGFVASVLKEMRSFPEDSVVHGHARFLSDAVLAVDDSFEVHARSVVIATGATGVIPDEFKVLGEHAVTSDAVFEWETLPESVGIFGAGPIALELGQALARLGVRVQIFGRNGAAAGLTDPEVRDVLIHALQEEVYLDADANILETKLEYGIPTVRYRASGGRAVTSQFEAVLVATGRSPALDTLQLDKTTLKLDKRGVPVFDDMSMQCGESTIFIAGDCDGTRPWLADATDEGTLAGHNAASFPDVQHAARKASLSIVFTDPQAAMIGASYKSLAGRDIVIGKVSFEDQGRSKIMRKNRGALRVYADACSGRLLGAEASGPEVEHLAHLFAWAVQLGLKAQDMLSLPFYHPVVEEGLRTALRDASRRLCERHSKPMPTTASAVGC